MGFDDFAMVEELASLVRDNLPCKHLVLSVEEALVKFLECDTSVDGVMELQPMNSYNRLLLHRLAEVFGFAHESVGEGDERHIVLERCPETSIPSILVSDLLGQYDADEVELSEVEKLASDVRDNLPCKHLILSVEETLVKILESESEDVLELEPMNSYNRHLLHRLADIFGFGHESVGRGDERRLILKRRLMSFTPDVLVSDVLREYDEEESPTVSLEVLGKKKEDSPGPSPPEPKVELSLEEREAAYLAARERIFSIGEDTSAEVKPRPQHIPEPKVELSLEEREAAYLAARERIFSIGEDSSAEVKPRPQHNPVVARRMIEHALGKKVKPANHEETLNDEERNKKRSGYSDSSSSTSAVKNPLEKIDNETKASKSNYQEEHAGAAKRMFVNALGFHPRSANLPGSGQPK